MKCGKTKKQSTRAQEVHFLPFPNVSICALTQHPPRYCCYAHYPKHALPISRSISTQPPPAPYPLLLYECTKSATTSSTTRGPTLLHSMPVTPVCARPHPTPPSKPRALRWLRQPAVRLRVHLLPQRLQHALEGALGGAVPVGQDRELRLELFGVVGCALVVLGWCGLVEIRWDGMDRSLYDHQDTQPAPVAHTKHQARPRRPRLTTSPVCPSTQGRLMREAKRTRGGSSGYRSPQWIFTS